MALLRRVRPLHDPADHRTIIEREFDDDYRDPHFPPGWYMLPFAGLGAFAVLTLFFL